MLGVRISIFAGFFLVSLWGSVGAAQTGAGASATAESLFREGRDLVTAGKYADACPKFEASYALEETLGTLLNLANCHELEGRTATAWAEFLRAGAMARAASQPDREEVARDRARTLEPRLVRLQIVVPDTARSEGLEITRDGVRVEPAAWGSAIPVDPGVRVIRSAAPDKQSREDRVELVTEGSTVLFELVPLLDEAPRPPVVAAPAEASRPVASAPPAAPPPSDELATETGSTQRTLGLVVGALGAAGIAAGSVFGALAKSEWDEAKEQGCGNGSCPTSAGQDASEEANRRATYGTIGLAGGGALLIAGAVLYFTAPSGGEQARTPGQGPRVSLGASWTPRAAAVELRGAF